MSGNGERDEQREERGFVVIDRRGSRSEEAPEAAAAEPAGAEAGHAAQAPPRSGRAGAPPPRVDFAVLAHSFFVGALYHMGLVPDPESGRPGPVDLPLAQYNIDLLELIQVKTRGNLDPEEERLLQGLLYEVRMRFVEAKKAAGG